MVFLFEGAAMVPWFGIPVDYEFNFPVAQKFIVRPREMTSVLGGLAKHAANQSTSGNPEKNLDAFVVATEHESVVQKLTDADNTIVVLWSDHGWHLGEKEHWQKFTVWRVCSRVPLIMRVPKGSPGLSAGSRTSRCSKPVNLLSLAPTLLELAGLPSSKVHDGPSLVPLLENPKSNWPHVSLTHLHHPGSFGLSDEGWRYIRYADGGEELYDIRKDPYEWSNLAGDKKHVKTLERLRKKAPAKFAKVVEPKLESLPSLKWKPLAKGAKAPPSKPDGGTFEVTFLNRSNEKVQLFWIDREGKSKPYALIESGGVKIQRTRPGAVWMIADAEEGKQEPLGYFTVQDRRARAVVPK